MRWPASPAAAAARIWRGLDKPWQEAFRQAWEALRTGNIAVGACASTSGGEIFGSALAHAETNVLARLPFRSRRDLVLTTTLQPCLQCAGAIRLGPVATVRFAGPDRYWDGCHDFGKLSAREANRTQPARIGPRLPAGFGGGRTVSAALPGWLTLHGVTRPVTITVSAQRDGTAIEAAGSLPVASGRWGITLPAGFGFLGELSGQATAEFLLILHRRG